MFGQPAGRAQGGRADKERNLRNNRGKEKDVGFLSLKLGQRGHSESWWSGSAEIWLA